MPCSLVGSTCSQGCQVVTVISIPRLPSSIHPTHASHSSCRDFTHFKAAQQRALSSSFRSSGLYRVRQSSFLAHPLLASMHRNCWHCQPQLFPASSLRPRTLQHFPSKLQVRRLNSALGCSRLPGRVLLQFLEAFCVR